MGSMVSSPPLPAAHGAESGLAALIERIAAADEQALAALYDSTSRYVYGLLLRITGDAAVAEDIALEVYMQVWRTAESYQASRGSAMAWLVMMARSRGLDWVRSKAGRRAKQESPIDERPSPIEPGASAEAAVLDDERARVVREAMAELPAPQRSAIELAFYQGMSHSEIAAHTKTPLGTVKARIRNGMLHLRGALEQYAGAA